MQEPLLFIAIDDLDTVINDFGEYNPVTVKDLNIELPKANYYPDFYILTQLDVVAISNSSFSFVPSMLNERAKFFCRPSLLNNKIIPFDPWDSYVLLIEKKENLPDSG